MPVKFLPLRRDAVPGRARVLPGRQTTIGEGTQVGLDIEPRDLDRIDVTLTALEIVLGIDNIIFISILAGKLPVNRAGPGADARAGHGHAHPDRLALLAELGHRPDGADLYRARSGDFGARLDSSDRRPVPAREEHLEIHEKLEGDEVHGQPERPRRSRQ